MISRDDLAKMNRILGIDPAAFAAWQARQTAAAALTAHESEAALSAEISRKSGINEEEFQAWLVAERRAGRGAVKTPFNVEGTAMLTPQALPR